MNRFLPPVLCLALGIGGVTPVASARQSDFEARLDLEAARLVAVQHDGQVKTFDSFARTVLKYVVSTEELRNHDPVYIYLDMMLSPQRYADRNFIYVKKTFTRQEIVRSIRHLVPPERRSGLISDAELDRIEEEGLVSVRFLDLPVVRRVLSELDRDVMRTSKEIQAITRARSFADAGVLARMLRIVPPPGGDPKDAWLVGEDLWGESPLAPQDDVHASVNRTSSAPELICGMKPETQAALSRCWNDVRTGWLAEDPTKVSQGLNKLAAGLASIEPGLYPSATRRLVERWYYRSYKLTPTWILYMIAVVFLLMAVVYRWRRARIIGMSFFVGGFALHTLAIGLRWYLAGRIPNANLFEAITASVWFGALIALVLEFVLRRSAVVNLPALCSSVCAMAALMAGHFMPLQLDSDIGAVMPVLDRTIWLYIHTNMIITSYCLIGCAAVSALLYLVFWGLRAIPPAQSLRLLVEGAGPGLAGAGAGGGAAMILGAGEECDSTDRQRVGLAKVFDGATMVFMELSFITLWTGIILGAVWADVSWGRPWGWDPKEVFALNTWLIFLILVHVRLKVRDKAFWTAVLALIGFGVMMFNWIAVNFVIVGLHSYA